MARIPVDAIRREQIVAAALAVIARRGCDAATLRGIAAEAGASTGLVTYHFRSKDEVLAAALGEVASRLERRLDAAMAAADDSAAQLLALADACVPEGEDGRLQQVLWAELWARAGRDPALRAQHAALYAGWRRRIARTVRRGQDEGVFRRDVAADTWARDLAALLDGLALHALLHAEALDADGMREAVRRHVAATLAPVGEV